VALLIAAETLVAAGIPMRKAMDHVKAVRSARYASMRSIPAQKAEP
jgi:hypothetical protein